ncbi:hypothetical protein FHL15_009360 [Xylaria flabelliformis]|uniref:Uncharacterized protein n=1 Tax=Xylaria flabelliformis TaxID=2512241 RepID=A0A553HPB6_9PEZI|nr:hypothetical protein FHL15_009360 [Xylaria flabelliformis]
MILGETCSPKVQARLISSQASLRWGVFDHTMAETVGAGRQNGLLSILAAPPGLFKSTRAAAYRPSTPKLDERTALLEYCLSANQEVRNGSLTVSLRNFTYQGSKTTSVSAQSEFPPE